MKLFLLSLFFFAFNTQAYAYTHTDHPVAVKDAGIIILNNYVPMLFERLGLVKDKHFKGQAEQFEAINYLHYLATGSTSTSDSLLALDKILCGIPVTTTVSGNLNPNSEQKKLVEGLIMAAISYWPAVGTSSLEGFRGNWLVRDGSLIEKDDHWELTVEKRTYDLLIAKSPFSFSVIKYPWMDKALHVIWKY